VHHAGDGIELPSLDSIGFYQEKRTRSMTLDSVQRYESCPLQRLATNGNCLLVGGSRKCVVERTNECKDNEKVLIDWCVDLI
jgi:hypothetical protein